MPHLARLSAVFVALSGDGAATGTQPPVMALFAALPVSFSWAQLGTEADADGGANRLSRSSMVRPSFVLFAIRLRLVAGNADSLKVFFRICTAACLWGFVVDMRGNSDAAVF